VQQIPAVKISTDRASPEAYRTESVENQGLVRGGKKEAGDLLQEAVHTERNFEAIFGDPNVLRIRIARARAEEEKAREEANECARGIPEVLVPRRIWDPVR
jgi:hypothetical protein